MSATQKNAVRLTMTFVDANATPANPDGDVTLRVLDESEVVLETKIFTLAAAEKVGTGAYAYDFVVPAGVRSIDHEWVGVVQGKQQCGREQIVVTKRTPQ